MSVSTDADFKPCFESFACRPDAGDRSQGNEDAEISGGSEPFAHTEIPGLLNITGYVKRIPKICMVLALTTSNVSRGSICFPSCGLLRSFPA